MKLLILSDGGTFTGLARVTHAIADRLWERHEVVILATNYTGDPHNYPYTLYPAAAGGGDPHGVARLPAILAAERPDVVLMIQDYWVINRWLDVLSRFVDRPRTIAYTPIDGGNPEPEGLLPLERADVIVAYTEYARQEMRKAGIQTPIEVIPHGVEQRSFYPADRAKIRQKLSLPPDAFVVFNGNRNQIRKNLAATIEGFCIFAQRVPNAYLYLHCESKRDYDIPRVYAKYREQYGIPEGRLIQTQANGHPNVTTDQLNTIYNLADVGINTAAGEGWGLVSCEQALCGVPQIVPGHTAQPEVWGDAALYWSPDLPVCTHDQLLTYWMVHPRTVADKLLAIYEHPDWAALGEKARQRMLKPEYNWDSIAARFEALLKPSLAPVVHIPRFQHQQRLKLNYGDYAGGIFNPGMIWTGDRYVGVARAEQLPFAEYIQDYHRESVVPYWLELSADCKVLEQYELPLKTYHPPGTARHEDYRLFHHGEAILASHTVWQKGEPRRVGLSQVSDSAVQFLGRIEQTLPPQPDEKNWGFWESDGQVLCLYSLAAPLSVQILAAGRVSPYPCKLRLPESAPRIDGTYVSVSSAPVRWDDEHLFFSYHCRRFGIYHHWGALCNAQSLEWVAYTPEPLLSGGAAEGNHRGYMILQSAHVNEEELLLFYGEGDQYCGVARMPKHAVRWERVAQ